MYRGAQIGTMSLNLLRNNSSEPDYREWEQYAQKLSDEDLLIHLFISNKLEEYEISALLKKEIDNRKQVEG